MRLLVITQTVDPHDSNLGFFCAWLRHLAAAMDELHVITRDLREASLPPNVHCYSLGKEQGRPRWQRLRRFHQLAAQLIVDDRPDAIFAHMCPEYVVAAAPYARRHGAPVVWWYTHRQMTWQVRLAERLATRIVTAVADSFPLTSAKVTVVGHGIDTEAFQPTRNGTSLPTDGPMMLLAAGRPSAVKRWDLLLQALAMLVHQQGRRDMRLAIAGCRREDLSLLIRRTRLEPYVHCLGAVPHDQMPARYQQADLVVNASPPGLFDKVVLEGLACGVPVVACNRAYAPLLGHEADHFLCPSSDPQALAAVMARALDYLDRHPRDVEQWRAAVVRHHSIGRLAERFATVLRGVTEP